VALNPHSEEPDLGAPPDYTVDHPDEHPEQWGWHGEWGRAARIAGWVIAILMLVMLTATHYNEAGTPWLLGIAVGLIIVLLWDIQRRKNAWRK
jgi:hypothetical protein